MNPNDANIVKFLVVQTQNHVNLDRQTTAEVVRVGVVTLLMVI